MHIPQSDTAAMEILSFEEAADRSTAEDYKDMYEMLRSADASMYECKSKMRAGRE